MMMALRTLGINLLGARNSALQNLVAEIPSPVVAHLLGYSHNCTSDMHNSRPNHGRATSRNNEGLPNAVVNELRLTGAEALIQRNRICRFTGNPIFGIMLCPPT
jgi:hypothetical protein